MVDAPKMPAVDLSREPRFEVEMRIAERDGSTRWINVVSSAADFYPELANNLTHRSVWPELDAVRRAEIWDMTWRIHMAHRKLVLTPELRAASKKAWYKAYYSKLTAEEWAEELERAAEHPEDIGTLHGQPGTAHERLEVIASTVDDIKPADVGLAEESWYIAQSTAGLWVAVSDVTRTPEFFDRREQAVAYWDEAAEAYRSMRN